MPSRRRRNPLRIAIISDLHSHLASKSPDASYLKVGALRVPANQHPAASLIERIRKTSLRADLLLVPGDLADQSNQEGMSHAWEIALEVGRELGVVETIPVLGNHDIDSRRRSGADPTHIPKNLRDGFPFRDHALCTSFFSDGCCILTPNRHVDVIAVNSVIDHHDSSTARKGTFDQKRIDRLKSLLESSRAANIRIALLHHHPTLHSSIFGSDDEVLPSGDALLELLRRHGCGLVIHGHKHHPRITDVDTPAGRLPVFCAGSFSAILRDLGSVTRNVFHLVTCEESGPLRLLAAQVATWEFRIGTGWVPAAEDSADISHLAGLGSTVPIETIRDSI